MHRDHDAMVVMTGDGKPLSSLEDDMGGQERSLCIPETSGSCRASGTNMTLPYDKKVDS